MRVLQAEQGSVGIVTVAPELDGGLDLVRLLRGRGHRRVHRALGCDLRAGQGRHPPRHHSRHASVQSHDADVAPRSPGWSAPCSSRARSAAEIICDGYHVHPAVVSLAVRAKSVDRDHGHHRRHGRGRAGGRRARPGSAAGRSSRDRSPRCSRMARWPARSSPWIARSACWCSRPGCRCTQAARLCATTPAAQLGLTDRGRLDTGTAGGPRRARPGARGGRDLDCRAPVAEH